MNRRFILVALAVVVPLTLFVAARSAASWRPTKVALIDPPNSKGTRLGGPNVSFAVGASKRAIVFPRPNGNGDIARQIFDLQTGKVRAAGKGGLVAGGGGEWEIKGGKTPQLVVRQNEVAERAYALPATDAAELAAMDAAFYQEAATVAANAERVELVVGAHYYRWNTASRVLERSTDCDMESELANRAIARDGQSILNAGLSQISRLSTRSGEFTRHSPLPKSSTENAYISAWGNYSVYDAGSGGATKWRVIDTASARELWNFELGNWQKDAVALAPDEKWLAIARDDRKIWELRDLQTGALIRTLPLVTGVRAGAFSPDGETLYSVADGVLYRQRAR